VKASPFLAPSAPFLASFSPAEPHLFVAAFTDKHYVFAFPPRVRTNDSSFPHPPFDQASPSSRFLLLTRTKRPLCCILCHRDTIRPQIDGLCKIQPDAHEGSAHARVGPEVNWLIHIPSLNYGGLSKTMTLKNSSTLFKKRTSQKRSKWHFF
jgi:hypothetical protein